MSTPTVRKQPGDSRLYSMVFSALLARGETVTGVDSVAITPTTASMLVVSGSATYTDTTALVRLEDGLSGQKYKVTIVVSTSAGNTLEGEGYVQLEDT